MIVSAFKLRGSDEGDETYRAPTALLGIGQNVMVRKGEDALHKKDFQRRSLSWIKTEAPLPVLEASADGGSAPAPVPGRIRPSARPSPSRRRSGCTWCSASSGRS